jgi:hypothetical protein
MSALFQTPTTNSMSFFFPSELYTIESVFYISNKALACVLFSQDPKISHILAVSGAADI